MMTKACRAAFGLVALAVAGASVVHGGGAVDGGADEGRFGQDPVADRLARVQRDAELTLGLSESRIEVLDVPETADAPFEVSLEVGGQDVTLTMRRHSVRGENFRVVLDRGDEGWEEIAPGPVRTVRGESIGDASVVAAGSVSEDGLRALVLRDGEKFWVEPMVGRSAFAELGDHVVYSASSVLDRGVACAATGFDGARPMGAGEPAPAGPQGIPADPAPDDPQADPDGALGCDGGLCVAEVAIDADLEYFQRHGLFVHDEIERVFNAVNLQYERDVQITHDLGTILVRTQRTYAVTDPVGLLTKFSNRWRFVHTDIERDVVHLFTGKQVDGRVIGIAYLSAICSRGIGYGLSQVDCCGTFASATDLVAHELGHNWSADHCSCVGWTMNPFLTTANRFHPQFTVAQIQGFRDSRDCLGSRAIVRLELPFGDTFDGEAIDATRWVHSSTTSLSRSGVDEPSGEQSVNLDGSDVLTSLFIDARWMENIRLRYWWQRQGLGDAPESGDDLVVQYYSAAEEWVTLRRYDGGAPGTPGFQEADWALPEDAQHGRLRLRFRATGRTQAEDGPGRPTDGFDDWFVDSVELTGEPRLPEPFVTLTPGPDQRNVGWPVAFTWDRSEASERYVLEVDDDPSFGSPEMEQTTESAVWTDGRGVLEPATRYYWRVSAENPNGRTAGSPSVGSFVTRPPAPGSAQLLGPLEQNVRTLTPTLYWLEAAHAEAYEVDIAEDPSFAAMVSGSGVLEAQTGVNRFVVPEGLLEEDRVYFWRVRSRNINGFTEGSPVQGLFSTVVPVTCAGDVDRDGDVDVNDLTQVVRRMGETGGDADADGSGVVDTNDVTFVVRRFGGCG